MTDEEVVKQKYNDLYLHGNCFGTWREIRLNISGPFENPQYIVLGEAMDAAGAWADAAKRIQEPGAWPMTSCKFNPNEWPYCWTPRPKKFWKQSRCLICGLWTVWTDLRFGANVRLCDGFKASRKKYMEVNKRAALEETTDHRRSKSQKRRAHQVSHRVTRA